MTKEFKTFLILDWKTGTFRVAKKKPTNLKLTDIPIDLTLLVTIPEKPMLVAKGELALSEAKVSKIFLEEIKE